MSDLHTAAVLKSLAHPRWLMLLAAVLAACSSDACATKNPWPARKGERMEPWQPEAHSGSQAPAPAAPVEGAPQALAEPTPAPIAPARALAPGQKQNSSVGVNIGKVDYYAEQVVFLDLTKQAADWGLGSGGQMPELDEHGFPRALAPGHQAGFIANAGKGGMFVLLYEGAGKLEVAFGGKTLVSAPGRDVLQLDGGEAHFRMLQTDPANPMRKIHIVPLEREADHEQVLFHPKFLELARPFSVLRFMDFFQINGSKQVHWRDRATPEDFTQGTEKGSAIEYAIALCNQLRADCWFNIPHMADDDYVRHYAALIKEKLAPDLKAYVEYSNEVWNFEHGNWIQTEGERHGLPKTWDTRLQWQAKRSVQIFDIFEKTLGKKRLVRVLAGQFWDLRLQILCDYEQAFQHADALAIAPYFCGELAGDETVGQIRALSSEQIAQRCDADIEHNRARLKGIKELANRYKLRLIGYEGGQHLVTGGAQHADEALQRKLNDVQRTATMGKSYTHYLNAWRDDGGEIMVLYKLVEGFSKWGRWGLLENMWQDPSQAPKYSATLSFMQHQPRWWSDASSDARSDARKESQ
jgi:hypothetical protein